ncbi:MFS transporter [Halioglobus maricola]|uniref:MFS transporter n=1 Tax=Halioglobus maricola TaxID=2601894 RepID=A0A5P9NNT5_9GAMM|nr:MFS transporter [Halioglobus maricola]QFU77452.1 MFS transporter [Halioglobus maricola]
MPLLFGVVLLDLIGFGIVIPILPFLSPQLGANELDIALIIVTYAACSGISGPFWGRLSDRLGRKPVIMLCLAGGALGYVALGLANELWMVFVARGFAGLMAGNFGVASAMMADITGPENRAKGMGLIGAAFGLGMVLGPLLGGLLAGDDGSFALPCIFAGVMSVLAIIAAAIFLPESLPPERRAANRAQQQNPDRASTLEVLKASHTRWFVFQYAVHNACVSSATYIFPLWVAHELAWTAREVGIVFGIQGMIMVLLQGGAMGALVRIFGEWRLLRLTVGMFFVGLVVAVFADTMPVMLASLFIGMSGATMCMPLLNTIFTQRTPAQYRGRLMGTTAAMSSWGRVAGPLVSGLALGVIGYSATWGIWAAVVAYYFAWVVMEAHRARSETAESAI